MECNSYINQISPKVKIISTINKQRFNLEYNSILNHNPHKQLIM